ncbi:MAG: hypothetical protein F4X62_12390 [Caldilineaceae bacterium SB0662_bin_25]|nr:hypothetical protein [Caldilineaceae bacterium SB0662_bin_25]
MGTDSEITLGDIFTALEEAETDRTRIERRIDETNERLDATNERIAGMSDTITDRMNSLDTLMVQTAAGVFAISQHLGITADVLEAANRAVEKRRGKERQ